MDMANENRDLGVIRRTVCAALVGMCLTGCAVQSDRVIEGDARVETAVSPGEARSVALQAARADAHRQILDRVREWNMSSGRTLGQEMDESPYVTAAVRRAVQLSRVIRSDFHDDGYARIVFEMDPERIRSMAEEAMAELR